MPASIVRLMPSRCPLSRGAAVGFLLAALLAPPHALAQSVSSTVAGTVVDQTRQSLPRATVTLVNELTGDLHGPRGAERVHHLRAAQHRRPAERTALDRDRAAEHRIVRRNRDRHIPGQHRPDAELGSVRAHHLDPD